jgi:hypothetical protein
MGQALKGCHFESECEFLSWWVVTTFDATLLAGSLGVFFFV